jgi:two-component system, OmpR family, alkaline phosphatase synthesis response regulator PhoP
MTPAILIVEDEESLSRTLALNLKLEGYEPVVATSGSEALALFRSGARLIDLALLDVMLPGMNGFELCGELKKLRPSLPVIFLTAKNQSSEKIEGLKLGADDYIVKPFELEELLLRISNVLKRNTRSSHEFSFGGGKINFDTFEITDVNGHCLTLSRREIGLLKLLTENVNRVISRDEIIEKLWKDDENASSRTIDNYILSFRKYFEEVPRQPRHFHSVRGVGYKFTL